MPSVHLGLSVKGVAEK